MSTKKLDRTVIEGGRLNTWERRQSNKEQRASERQYLSKINKDPENYDQDILDDRKHVSKEFDDKLKPMSRWLEAQVGCKWSEVHSEIFKKFNIKTTAGRHIVFDHLLSSVVDTISGRDNQGRIASEYLSYSKRYSHYYVDNNDILRKNDTNDHSYYESRKNRKYDLTSVGEWLAGRMIGEKGGVLYWFTTLDGFWKSSWEEISEKTKRGWERSPERLRYFILAFGPEEVRPYGWIDVNDSITLYHKHWKYIENPAGFKQRAALTKEEVKTFKSLDLFIKTDILEHGNKRF